MPCSGDAGWIIHRELFIPGMWLAFLLNTLLASFDFWFHYSPCSNPKLLISASLFSKAEKRNTWDTTFSWCDPAKRLPGNGQPGSSGLSLELWKKQCSYPIQLQMNSVTPGKSLCSPFTSGCTFIKWTEYFTVRYCKARYVKLASYYGNWESS